MVARSKGFPKVETYHLHTATGKHIGVATKVTFRSGKVVRFIERISKGRAIEQAKAIARKDMAMQRKASVPPPGKKRKPKTGAYVGGVQIW